MLDQAQQPPESAGRETRLWRSLAELENDPQFLAKVEQEFAPGAQWWIDQPSRRTFLQRMSAAFALAGLTGCIRQPKEEIVPYVQTPEDFIPGDALMFATAMPQPGGALGILVKSHEGRPTKVEGNKLHPSSLGATDTFAQASVLNLYDPHRSRVVRIGDRLSNWLDFQAAFQPQFDLQKANGGRGMALLTEGVLSPTLKQQLTELQDQLPELRWYQFEPSLSSEVTAAAQTAFGQPVVPFYRLSDADIILSVDADFLGEGPARTRLNKEFSARRRVDPTKPGNMNRLYVAECSPTVTGACADHWQRLNPSQLAALLVEVARQIGVDVAGITAPSTPLPDNAVKWIAALAGDLQAARGRSVIIAGPALSPALQVLVHAMNSQLGNLGATVTLREPVTGIAGRTARTLAELSADLDGGLIESLLILGGDPVYTAPREFQLADKIRKLPFSIHYGLYLDATSAACQWHLPATHDLEHWSDTLAEDGTATIIQPLISPLYDGRSPHEVLNMLLGRIDQTGKEAVEAHWRGVFGADASAPWLKSLQDGVVAGFAGQPVSVTLAGNLAEGINRGMNLPTSGSESFVLLFRNDVNLLDGRYTTNAWLQELPRPITKLTWGNTAWISQASAQKLNLKNGSHIEIGSGDGFVEIPVWIQPGQPDGVLTLSAGLGRQVSDAEVVGIDVGPLRTQNNWWLGSGQVKATGRKTVLATTQEHHLMEGRDLVRVGTLDQLKSDPEHPEFMHVGHSHMPPKDKNGNFPTLYPDWPQNGPQWGMSINLGACTGCNACVVACQSENNIPTVGADQIRRGREMYWLRIDSYFAGEPESPEIYHQPVMCMHCEHAPCEPVCPVGATTHSDSGLNEMTYNRCIGTRYCSNNCPYKVRRFNFLDFREDLKEEPVLQLLPNPNVTVRSRGVMEKCTYCVQRINSVRIQSKIEGREIRDGEIVTACQSACPADCISFGNIADENSEVAKQKATSLNYGLLEELNTRPRTSYLAAVKNPHPDLAPVATAKEHEHA